MSQEKCAVCGTAFYMGECSNAICRESQLQDRFDVLAAEREALAAELAALKKRIAEARAITLPNVDGWFLLFPMNDGEIREHLKLRDGET